MGSNELELPQTTPSSLSIGTYAVVKEKAQSVTL